MTRVISIIFLIGLMGCGNKNAALAPAGYIQFLEEPDNGYNRKIVAGKTEYEVQMATAEYMALKGADQKQGRIDTASFNIRLADMKNHIFFLLKLKNPDAGGVAQDMVVKNDAERMVMYYQGAAADFTLKWNSQEYKPATYMFENNYSLVPYNTLIVGFVKPEGNGDLELVFNDRYRDNPYLKATYSQKELADIPALKIK